MNNMIDVEKEKVKITQEIQEFKQRASQIEQMLSNIVREIVKREGMLELLGRMNNTNPNERIVQQNEIKKIGEE